MLRILEVFAFIIVGAIAIRLGLSFTHPTSKPDEEVQREAKPTTTEPPAVAVTDSTPTAEAPATNEEEAPPAQAAPEQNATSTFKVHCYAGNVEVFGLEKVTDDTMERDGDRWKFTNIDGSKTVYFTGTCLIQQD